MKFTPLTKEDAPALGAVLEQYGAKFCDDTFLLLYMWGEVYVTDYARVGELWLLRSTDPTGEFYYYTIPHRGEDFLRGLSLLEDEAPGKLLLWALDEETCAIVKARYGEHVTISSRPEEADYLYELAALAEMRGRALAAKRNHINAFLREQRDWRYEPITAENLPAVQAFYRDFQESEQDESETAQDEGEAAWRLINDFLSLPAEGGVLYAGGRIVGFFIGEVVGEVLFLHIEKALREVRGAYPMLVRETAKRYLGRARYENREEDDGDEGLRRSKRSYAPCAILEKYTAALSL